MATASIDFPNEHDSMNHNIRNSFLLSLTTVIVIGISFTSCAVEPQDGAGEDWSHYLGHPTSNQYSTLEQINTANVDGLEIAWTYDTGDSSNFQTNNLIVHGVLYSATPERRVTALNAGTGKHLWTFDPRSIHDIQGGGAQRGVMYWEDGDDRRVLTSRGPWFYALDASTGEPIASFGEGGFIHLGEGMDVEGRPNVFQNTPGYVYNDMIIIGATMAHYTS
jgi:quinoprotein glucose dehydrogenase